MGKIYTLAKLSAMCNGGNMALYIQIESHEEDICSSSMLILDGNLTVEAVRSACLLAERHQIPGNLFDSILSLSQSTGQSPKIMKFSLSYRTLKLGVKLGDLGGASYQTHVHTTPKLEH